jgi:hypothetical protein
MPRGASHEVCGSFSTIHPTSPLTRACLTRYVPPAGFHTLLTVYSSPDYPALFHAGALMEFPVPSELSPRPEPERLSAPRCPLAVDPLPATVAPPGGGAAAVIAVRAANTSRPRDVSAHPSAARDDVAGRRVRLQGFAPRGESVASPRRLGQRRARCSPGIRPSARRKRPRHLRCWPTPQLLIESRNPRLPIAPTRGPEAAAFAHGTGPKTRATGASPGAATPSSTPPESLASGFDPKASAMRRRTP